MACQRDISAALNENHLDKTLTVLIEDAPEDNLMVGRTVFQAPEVDGITYVKSPNLDIGTFAKVKITDTLEYDLIGEPCMTDLKTRLLNAVEPDLVKIEQALKFPSDTGF